MIINKNNDIIPPGSDFMEKYIDGYSKDFEKLLLKKIDTEIGSIKEIIKDEYKLKEVVAHEGTQFYFLAFITKLNEEIANGNLNDEDLKYLRTGVLADLIVNLEAVAKEIRIDEPSIYMGEKRNKLSWVSLIKDEKILAATYTHPEILNSIIGKDTTDKSVDDLKLWVDGDEFKSLPASVKAKMALKMLEFDNISKAIVFLKDICENIPEYSNNKPLSEVKKESDERLRKAFIEDILRRSAIVTKSSNNSNGNTVENQDYLKAKRF